MPAQQQNVGAEFFKAMGQQVMAAHNEHKDTEVDLGNMGKLPGGIEGGIAQLVDMRIGKHDDPNKKDIYGKFFYRAAAVVVQPETFTDKQGNVHHVAGRQTSIFEPLYDTPSKTRKTFSEHMSFMYNELKKLGVDTSKLDPSNLEVTMQALLQMGLYTQFRTSELPVKKPGEPGYDPRYADRGPSIYESWHGAVDYTPAETGGGVADGTAPPPVNNAPPTPPAAPPTAPKAPPVNKPAATPQPAPKPTPAPVPPPDTSADMGDDWTSLGKLADANDDSAGVKLTAAAEAHGIDTSTLPDWSAVANAIIAKQSASAAPAASDDPYQGWSPKPRETYTWLPPKKGPGGRVMGRMPKVDILITAVDTAAYTFDAKNITDGKTVYTGVKWDDLMENQG